jgi:hypothetical protein
MKRQIVIVSGNHPCSNPRVVKEADALVAASFAVTVIGGSVSSSQKAKDLELLSRKPWRYVEAFDMTGRGLKALWLKLQRRAGIAWWNRFQISNCWQLFYGVDAIRRAVRTQAGDLVIAHWEPALPATIKALADGHAAGVDMEDWFSEDLPAESRAGRPVKWLAEMEARLLRDGRHTTCTSEAMADALVARYECRRPVVVRNVFPRSEREGIDGGWKDRSVDWHPRNEPDRPRPVDASVSFHWFSQTIGPHRGLESVFRALGSVEGAWELHLRGDLRGHERWLETECPRAVRSRIRVHDLVEPGKLASRIAEHDVGLACEARQPRSRDVTITNKVFQYLQGGLAVVASATAGQKEGAGEAPGAVMLYQPGDVEELRQVLQLLIHERTKLRAMRAAAWEAGGRLCWENEAPKLVESVERAIGERDGRSEVR